MEKVMLTGKTVVVTGANGGIGKETARELAARGARVILGCRDAERADEARQDIVKSTGNSDVHVMILNLASFQSIRGFVDKFKQQERRLDILINNAGVLTQRRKMTDDCFEMMFGVNHLGHFLLTYLLLDKLKSSAPSRVVTLSSVGHQWAPLDFNDLQSERSFGSIKVYGKSKTANLLFTTHLAELTKGQGISAYAVHPGYVETGLAREMDNCCFKCCFAFILKCCERKLLSSADGAKTSLYCAMEPSIASHSGRYYTESKESRAKSHATDPEKARKLWEASVRLCGLDQEKPI
ncbi:hypothetical protein CAPTEDRAFT_159772 [Capitella teleta]|uniref:Retinol dehydrogenase 12 n=1 Tax=Capitella teleta TaxID=283909 RepID=R7UTA5_CAPTE|nr:hypothetical protein CAPTEDRAFT_159772 [Capitella teleta]|eukprot:ELU09744.1 hypothetical protein CAPTEDRAFT_159772 [Capitella teleta]